MPLTYEVNTAQRLVIARCHGVLTYDDLLNYQASLWSRPEVAGFDEIVDVAAVEKIAYKSPHQVGDLAERAASMDSEKETFLAIVAPDFGAYGLARMYQTYRSLQAKSRKTVAVFRSFEKASEWIANERRKRSTSASGGERSVRSS